MNRMDSLTLNTVILWAIFIVCPLLLIWWAVTMVRGRRKDRERAAQIAGLGRGLPDDPLECWEQWEQVEWERIVTFYADTPDDPAARRRGPA